MDKLHSNEIFLFDRQRGGALRVLNCFPNTYEVGMASLGFQTVFKLFGSHAETHSTRYFSDWHEPFDKNPDLVTFSISWELDFIFLLDMLSRLQIPLLSSQREALNPLVCGGGPVLTANPEPWAEFFDLILMGDIEGRVDGLVKTSLEARSLLASGKSRREALELFRALPGVYIPALMEQAPERVKSPSSELAYSSVIAPDSAWQDTGLLEVVRSCPEMCKFCLASFASLPFRAPQLWEDLIPKVQKLREHSSKIGLLGASVSQHPRFMDLLHYLSEHQADTQLQVASVRASTVSKNMTDILASLGVRNLTIAIESGSERLREDINKKLAEEYIFSAASAASSSGLNSLKLYGMVGLPTEEDSDIDLTIDLLSRLKGSNPGLKIVWGCSVFTPKMLTPYYRYGIDPLAERKLKHMEKELHKLGIEMRAESYKWAQVQALISRGDRSLSKLLMQVQSSKQKGANIYRKLLNKEKYQYFVFEDWA